MGVSKCSEEFRASAVQLVQEKGRKLRQMAVTRKLSQKHRIIRICKALGISRAGYYARHSPDPGLIHHFDRGVWYCSEEYQKLLAEHHNYCLVVVLY